MSEIEKNEKEPIFMEQDEYIEYLQNQIKKNKSENQHPVAQISMYQMNKDLIQNLKKMTNMEVNNALDKVYDWYLDCIDRNPRATYWALLNHEKHYFTIFTRDRKKRVISTREEAKSFVAELKDILTNYYGDNDLRAIDVDSNGAVEIWGMFDKEPSVAYLFPYDEGVVYY